MMSIQQVAVSLSQNINISNNKQGNIDRTNQGSYSVKVYVAKPQLYESLRQFFRDNKRNKKEYPQ